MAAKRGDAKPGDERDGVALTNLDQPLFDGAESTKRDLVDYLDVMSDRLIGALRDRPLSVIRVRPGQAPFMQKNLPSYAPDWIGSVTAWAESSHRKVAYALCDDRRTLLWFGNQRAVEYHVPLFRAGRGDRPDYLVMDIDPPEGGAFAQVVAAARLVRTVMRDAGIDAAIKTSGAKGLHLFMPLTARDSTDDRDGTDSDGTDSVEDIAAATRAIAARAERLDPSLATTAFVRDDRGGRVFLDSTRAGGATVAAAYSPRIRPGVPVSYPLSWDDLDEITPGDFTLRTVPALLGGADPWRDRMPDAQRLPADLIAEGHTIPIARVAAMHEGKRRKRAGDGGSDPR